MKALILAKYAPHALKGLISGSDREAAGKKLMDSVGGSVEQITFVRGIYDIVVRVEVEDQETAIGLVLAIKASGTCDQVDYLEEVNIARIVQIAQTASSAYTPAG